jgi:hypothetical protein
MPRTKFDKEERIDWILAAILYRKMRKHVTYEELARGTNVSPEYLRKLVATKDTWDWSPDIRNSICRQLRIGVQSTLSLVTEDEKGIRLN